MYCIQIVGRDTKRTLLMKLSPRLLKVYWILRLFRRGVARVIYVDLDVLFLSPSADIIHQVMQQSVLIALSLDWKSNTTQSLPENDERFNTGVMLLKKSAKSEALFTDIFTRGLKLPQNEVSDQRLFNAVAHSHLVPGSELLTIDRVKYNAFPLVSDDRHKAMGFPPGDETQDSHLLHFAGKRDRAEPSRSMHDWNANNELFIRAGAFGGALQESGKTDLLALLLVYREMVNRHNAFLSLSAGLIIDKHRPVIKGRAGEKYLNQCIDEVFKDFDNERAENKSRMCMVHISSSFDNHERRRASKR